MKNILAFLSLIICLLIVTSCEKEHSEHILIDVSKEPDNQFQKCDCGLSNTPEFEAEYIKAEFNGVAMCFDVKAEFSSDFDNLFSFGYIMRDTGQTYFDNVHLIRNAKNSPWQIAIYLENTHALTKTYPYKLPRPNPEICEIGGFQLNYHYENKFSNPFWGNGMFMTVNSFENGFFEGTFYGTVRSKTNEEVKVTKGAFKIKLAIKNKDISLITK